MGMTEVDPVIYHFSHHHPLKLLNFQPYPTNRILCSCCKIEASGWIYSCSVCNYYLHKSCSQMPKTLNHPIDSNHLLVLLPSPIYQEGAFKCNACGELGFGFCYHCKACDIDLHTVCASRPPLVNHPAHHHPLSLCLEPPYTNKLYQCDVCKNFGSNHWLYRCNFCCFDAHINCAMSQPTSTFEVQHGQQSYLSMTQMHRSLSLPSSSALQIQNPIPQVGFSSLPCPYDQVNSCMSAPRSSYPHFLQPARENRIAQDIVESMVEGAVEGFAQQAGQVLFQAVFGGN